EGREAAGGGSVGGRAGDGRRGEGEGETQAEAQAEAEEAEMTDIAGFDVCMAIGAPGLGQALQSRIQPLARPALLGMLLPLPNAPTSTLDVNIAFPANSSIDGVQHRV